MIYNNDAMTQPFFIFIVKNFNACDSEVTTSREDIGHITNFILSTKVATVDQMCDE